jgi:hypothetical protein
VAPVHDPAADDRLAKSIVGRVGIRPGNVFPGHLD